jgi:hypothetical protein
MSEKRNADRASDSKAEQRLGLLLDVLRVVESGGGMDTLLSLVGDHPDQAYDPEILESWPCAYCRPWWFDWSCDHCGLGVPSWRPPWNPRGHFRACGQNCGCCRAANPEDAGWGSCNSCADLHSTALTCKFLRPLVGRFAWKRAKEEVMMKWA